jgi:H+/Cl- antiporter ClcA
VRLKPRISRETVNRRSQRLVFIIGGLIIGGAAVLIALLADVAQGLFRELLAAWPYAPLIVTPIGFGLASLLTRKIFEGAEGSGIPQVIAARQSRDDAFRRSLVSMRIAFGKIVVLTLGLLCGASSGREGPRCRSVPRSCSRSGGWRRTVSAASCWPARLPVLPPHSTRRLRESYSALRR